MKGIRPAFYAIIAVTLIISVCGSTDQRVGNTTIQATNTPLEVPTASITGGALGAATSVHPSATPTTAPRSTITLMPSIPLTGGTSFPCIHETAASTSVGVVTKVIDGHTTHVLTNGTDYKVQYIVLNAPRIR